MKRATLTILASLLATPRDWKLGQIYFFHCAK
jgi:hypothetical protein